MEISSSEINQRTGQQSPEGGGGTAIYNNNNMGYIGMCLCEGHNFQAVYSRIGYINQAPVVQRLDNAIHRINHYPANKC